MGLFVFYDNIDLVATCDSVFYSVCQSFRFSWFGYFERPLLVCYNILYTFISNARLTDQLNIHYATILFILGGIDSKWIPLWIFSKRNLRVNKYLL